MAKSKPKRAPVDKDGSWDPTDTCEVSIAVLMAAIIKEGIFAYDLETTGLNPRQDRIEGIAFYVPNEKDPSRKPIRAWFPFTQGTMDYTVGGEVRALREPMPQRETMEKLRPIFQLKNVIAIRHNGIFDDSFLYLASGLDEPLIIDNIIADSMLADYVADERRKRYGLKLRVEQVFGHKMTTYNEAVGGQATFGFAHKKPLGVYACDDTAWTYRLFKWAIDQIRMQDPCKEHKDDWCSPMDDTPGVYSDLEKIFWKIEMKIQRILMEMELTGCFIDWEWLVTVQERILLQKKEIEEEFKTKVGWMPNLRSPKQVSDFLYKPTDKGGLGLPTKGVDYNDVLDQYATGDKAISHRKAKFPLVSKLLKYRSLGVIESSFCQKLIKIAQADENQRVHARFRQTGTVIGRLSCISGASVLSIRLKGEDFRRSVRISELGQFAGSDVTIITHKGRERRVLNLFNKGPGLMFEVTTDDGSTIRCTKDHRFLTMRGWYRLADIQQGDRLIRAEVREAETCGAAAEVGAGQAFLPEGLRRGRAGGLQEGEVLRHHGGDLDHLQGGLRVGVSWSIPGHIVAASRPRRDPSQQTHVGETRQVEGVHAFRGVLPGDLRRERSDPRGSEVSLRDLTSSSNSSRADLSGIQEATGHQARSTLEVIQAAARDLLPEGRIVPSSGGGAVEPTDRRSVRGRRVIGDDGSSSSRIPKEPNRSHLVAVDPQSRGVCGTHLAELGDDRTPDRAQRALRGVGGDVSESFSAGSSPEGGRVRAQLLRGERRSGKGAPHLRREQVGDASVSRPPSDRNTSPEVVLLLQELAGGLCVAGAATDGRGRWRISPELRDDQSQRSTEGEEGEGAWLSSSEIYDEASGQKAPYSAQEDLSRTWTRVASITPIGVEDVWDIEVEEDHSYAAHGLINHNSADPVNLMNQPRDKDLIRKAFCAHLEDDYDQDRSELCLIDADYGQMELRMAAHLACEKNMMEVFNNVDGCSNGENGGPCERYTFYECFTCHKKAPPVDTPDGPKCSECGETNPEQFEHQKRCRHVDPHQRTSEDVGVPRNPLAKNANFGLLYRMGAPKFCVYAGLYDDAGDPRVEYGQQLIERWHQAYPGISTWHERVLHQLLRDNYIAYNIAKRRRRLDIEWKKNEYRAGTQAIQFRVSGSCQDLIKLAMIRLYDTRNKKVANCRPAEAKLWRKFRFMIQVHDELIFEGPKALKEELCLLVKESMEGVARGMRVPFVADARAGRTWDELH